MADSSFDDRGADPACNPETPFRVLHVADDIAMADMYALGLEMQGFEVLRADDGGAALETASTRRADVVVIDMGLSAFDGLDVVALLRQDPRTAGIPAILLASSISSQYREEAAALGVDDLLLKSDTTPSKLGEAIDGRLQRLNELNAGSVPGGPMSNGTRPIATMGPLDEPVKVLVVEDDPSVAEMYRLRLVSDGYEVVVGCDGEEGLQLAIDEDPDFIYLDVRLPKLDGFEVLERLRAVPATAQIPVIILSNYGDPDMRDRGLRLGALEFLVKADTAPRQLAVEVERTIGTPAAQTSARSGPSRSGQQ